jgi:Domain of unknown function (DUF4394)
VADTVVDPAPKVSCRGRVVVMSNAASANVSGSVFAAETYMAALRGGQSRLYTINLSNGVAALAGRIGNGSASVQGLAVHRDVVPGGRPAIALQSDGTQLVRFNTASPDQVTSVTIVGVAAGETVAVIDWRPNTGQLYALGANAGADTATTYRIDPQTGQASPVGAVGQVAFVDGVGSTIDLPIIGFGYGFDFNPTVDRIRVVTGSGLNFRVNPITGSPIDGNGFISGTNPDGPINGLPAGSTGVGAAAYTNSLDSSSSAASRPSTSSTPAATACLSRTRRTTARSLPVVMEPSSPRSVSSRRSTHRSGRPAPGRWATESEMSVLTRQALVRVVRP